MHFQRTNGHTVSKLTVYIVLGDKIQITGFERKIFKKNVEIDCVGFVKQTIFKFLNIVRFF